MQDELSSLDKLKENFPDLGLSSINAPEGVNLTTLDQTIVEKYVNILVEGIKTKMSQHYVEGRVIFISSNEEKELRDIAKLLFISFYNESNGQG